jgi:transcriptional regulator GlxA family with amidase domain
VTLDPDRIWSNGCAHVSEPLTVERLADRAAMSAGIARTFSVRHFKVGLAVTAQ